MSLDATLRVLNDLQSSGALGEYAIGGAIAALVYLEPVVTRDVDVFIAWKAEANGLLSTLPLHDELNRRGYNQYEDDGILIEGWPVQFLPATTPLVEEALADAIEGAMKGVPVRVFTKEHLMAICLETGRHKDLQRLIQFLDLSEPDMQLFEKIVERHKLSERWEKMKNRLEPL